MSVLYIHTMFIIQFRKPYSGSVTTQSFSTKEDADRMISLYAECGVKAKYIL